MSTHCLRKNEERLTPRQRRRAVILLLTAGLGRMIGVAEATKEPDFPTEKSAENGQKDLGLHSKTRLDVPTG